MAKGKQLFRKGKAQNQFFFEIMHFTNLVIQKPAVVWQAGNGNIKETGRFFAANDDKKPGCL
ncbi:MAG: hypothetical protein ACREC8_03440 [Limisphaerales bacterium]